MNGIGSVTAAPVAQDSAASRAKVDYDAFLQLLVAEMQNQDPTKPMDSTEFIAQLASFSNVEQAVQTNAKLDALLSAGALSSAVQVAGQTISTIGGEPGRVASVEMRDDGAVALMDDGREVSLASGWVLRAPEAQ